MSVTHKLSSNDMVNFIYSFSIKKKNNPFQISLNTHHNFEYNIKKKSIQMKFNYKSQCFQNTILKKKNNSYSLVYFLNKKWMHSIDWYTFTFKTTIISLFYIYTYRRDIWIFNEPTNCVQKLGPLILYFLQRIDFFYTLRRQHIYNGNPIDCVYRLCIEHTFLFANRLLEEIKTFSLFTP